MKDLDFDELDRAVNSLMAGVSKTPPQNQPTEKTLDIGTSSNASVSSAPQIQSSPLESNDNQKKIAQNAPAVRRNGRFMDVVHPTSAMKKAEAPSERVSRQAAMIEPKSPASEESLADEKAVEARKESSVVETPTQKSLESLPAAEPHPTVHSDWPDPLEVAGFNASPPSENKEVETTNQNETQREVTLPSQTASIEQPLTSPFLTDTKVDKRPLGANASSVSEETPKDEVQVSTRDFTDTQLPATLDDTKPVLPEELHNDLVAIESDTTEPQLENTAKPVTETEDLLETIPKTPIPTIETNGREASYNEQSHPLPPGPVSIPQQYKEEPSSNESKNGAIYDTDTYHQPLAHPAKTKSGWLWVIWIILILLAGAGVGAALYFFGVV